MRRNLFHIQESPVRPIKSFQRRVTNTDLYQKALTPASILSALRPSLGVL
ncbi:hypothetical protein SARI_04574 [Salmonella enterica subsp. arizonae serovar 62:z4,z23:-]|uniref:Uncharacterized protein n=1 Tax=Salmonella arizonae (strain ATCC BAA-731 / CDC346-86 / RSK2980) TaxID=41514 RepID=A9MRE9_SALAR|nr:hypothetical protein SARI_04574 [Salmonella enterica subsp. arizonae serovar 62:z4,z23:-]